MSVIRSHRDGWDGEKVKIQNKKAAYKVSAAVVQGDLMGWVCQYSWYTSWQETDLSRKQWAKIEGWVLPHILAELRGLTRTLYIYFVLEGDAALAMYCIPWSKFLCHVFRPRYRIVYALTFIALPSRRTLSLFLTASTSRTPIVFYRFCEIGLRQDMFDPRRKSTACSSYTWLWGASSCIYAREIDENPGINDRYLDDTGSTSQTKTFNGFCQSLHRVITTNRYRFSCIELMPMMLLEKKHRRIIQIDWKCKLNGEIEPTDALWSGLFGEITIFGDE